MSESTIIATFFTCHPKSSTKTWYASLGNYPSVNDLPQIRDFARNRPGFEIPKYFDVIKVFVRGHPRQEVQAKFVREGLLTNSRRISWSNRSFSWSGPIPGSRNQLDIGFGVDEGNMTKLRR